MLEQVLQPTEATVLSLGGSWAQIHAALVEDSKYPYDEPYPLCRAILGGEMIFRDDETLLLLVSPVAVKDVAASVSTVHSTGFKVRLRQFAFPDLVPEESEIDELSHLFNALARLYSEAAGRRCGMALLFRNTDEGTDDRPTPRHSWLFAAPEGPVSTPQEQGSGPGEPGRWGPGRRPGRGDG